MDSYTMYNEWCKTVKVIILLKIVCITGNVFMKYASASLRLLSFYIPENDPYYSFGTLDFST